jgi:hypothetical protein
MSVNYMALMAVLSMRKQDYVEIGNNYQTHMKKTRKDLMTEFYVVI